MHCQICEFSYVVINYYTRFLEIFMLNICKWISFFFFSRVCVELPLPSNVYFKMEAILHDWSKYERQVLHVQSISFWAPANIGPYSQAVKVSFNICSDAKPSGTFDAFLVIALILYLLKSSENLRGFKIRRSARNGLRIKVRNKSTTLVSFLTPWKY